MILRNFSELSFFQFRKSVRVFSSKVGGAKVSDRHGNFILTDSRATASDVYALIQYIKEEIFNIFGVRLSEEVEYIGEF